MPDKCSGSKLRVAYPWRIDFSFPLLDYTIPIKHFVKIQWYYYMYIYIYIYKYIYIYTYKSM